MKALALIAILMLAGCGTVDLSQSAIYMRNGDPKRVRFDDRPTYILLGKDGSAIRMPDDKATSISQDGDKINLR